MKNVYEHQDTSHIQPIPGFIRYLDIIVDKLFISSFILNKIKDLPLNQFSIFLTNIAVICIAIAFTIQVFTSQYYQSASNQDTSNLPLRTHLFANIGAISAWMCIIFPNLWLISLWMFCFNNFFWTYNEYSKQTSPSVYPPMPLDQEKYCYYVLNVALATLVSAIANTLGLYFINQTTLILTTGIILNWTFSFIGVDYLYKATGSELPLPSLSFILN